MESGNVFVLSIFFYYLILIDIILYITTSSFISFFGIFKRTHFLVLSIQIFSSVSLMFNQFSLKNFRLLLLVNRIGQLKMSNTICYLLFTFKIISHLPKLLYFIKLHDFYEKFWKIKNAKQGICMYPLTFPKILCDNRHHLVVVSCIPHFLIEWQ